MKIWSFLWYKVGFDCIWFSISLPSANVFIKYQRYFLNCYLYFTFGCLWPKYLYLNSEWNLIIRSIILIFLFKVILCVEVSYDAGCSDYLFIFKKLEAWFGYASTYLVIKRFIYKLLCHSYKIIFIGGFYIDWFFLYWDFNMHILKPACFLCMLTLRALVLLLTHLLNTLQAEYLYVPLLVYIPR